MAHREGAKQITERRTRSVRASKRIRSVVGLSWGLPWQPGNNPILFKSSFTAFFLLLVITLQDASRS
jgi:hypothetical protein